MEKPLPCKKEIAGSSPATSFSYEMADDPLNYFETEVKDCNSCDGVAISSKLECRLMCRLCERDHLESVISNE